MEFHYGAERNLSASISFHVENFNPIESFDSSKITFVNKKTDYSVFSYDKTEILNATNTLGYSRTERDKDSFLNSLSDDAIYLSESIVY